jgi:hypothetical protein
VETKAVALSDSGLMLFCPVYGAANAGCIWAAIVD